MNVSLKEVNVIIYTYRLGYCLHSDGSGLDPDRTLNNHAATKSSVHKKPNNFRKWSSRWISY